MIINLFVLIISYFFFFLTILGSGILLNNFVIKEKDISLGETGIFGFINIYFIILIIHFFSPIKDYIIITLFILFLFFFLKNYKNFLHEKKISYKKLSVVFTLFLIISITNNHHDDLYIFQLPIINYMQNFKVVFGLINLNDFIGQGQSFYEIMSLFKIPFYGNRVYFLIPIIFLNFFIIYLLENLYENKSAIIKNFVFFIIILLIIRFNRSKEYGTDLPILCLLFYIQINFYKFLENREVKFFSYSILSFIFAVILKLYSILSIFYLLPFLYLLKNKSFLILKNKTYIFFIILLVGCTIFKNIIVSGCVVYPIKQSCFEKDLLPWSITKEIAHERNIFYSAQVMGWKSFVKSQKEKKYIAPDEFLKISKFKQYKYLFKDKDVEKLLTVIAILIIFFIFSFNSRNKILLKNLDISSKMIILFCFLMPLLIWFLKIPQSRYGYFSYISFFSITLFYFFNKLGELNLKIIKFSSIILITFLITKNFNRIYKEVTIKDFLKNEYPIKNFRTSNFTASEINGIKVNFPTDSVLECANIKMLCGSYIESINKIEVSKNYYFIINDPIGLKKHIKKSGIVDTLEMNN